MPEPRVGERRLTWADRVVYAIIFAAVLFAMFFMEAR